MSKLTIEVIDRVIAHFGNLTDYGLGVYAMYNGNWLSMAKDERLAKIKEGQDRLRRHLDGIQAVYDWLPTALPPTRTVSSQVGRGSYELKHLAEKDIGVYVCNGEFIAAAFLRGYKILDSWDSPNPIIGVHSRDVQKLYDKQNGIVRSKGYRTIGARTTISYL